MRTTRPRPIKNLLRTIREMNWKKKTLLFFGLWLVLMIVIFFTVKPVKFAVLNIITDSNMTIKIVDTKSGIPVGGVTVTVDDDIKVTSGSDGIAYIEDLDFGSHSISLTKPAYKQFSLDVIVDSKNYDAGEVSLNPTGKQIIINVLDSLSGDSLADFSINVAGTNISEQSSPEGLLGLIIPDTIADETTLIIESTGYLGIEEVVNVNEKSQFTFKLLPSGRHNFLSNRTGEITIYSSNLDGSDSRKVISATGNEDRRTELYSSPDGRKGILVASRTDKVKNGVKLREIYYINYENSKLTKVDSGALEWQIIDVNDNRVLYWSTNGKEDKSDNEKIKKFVFNQKEPTTIFNSKDISSPIYADGKVLFAENIVRNEHPYGFLSRQFIVLTESSGDTRVLFSDHDTYVEGLSSPTVVEYRVFNEATDQFDTYRYDVRSDTNNKVTSGTNKQLYNYYQSPSKNQNAWLERRDGRGTIIVGNNAGEESQKVDSGLNITSIVRWYDEENIIVYVINSEESAHYIVNLESGNSIKISDVFRFEIF